MEITQLHYFKTVAKYESFTKAAQELHITQPALSHSVSTLEKEIGFLLFERRKGGRITLNKDGRFFLSQVINILNSLENTVSAVREMAGLQRGVIDVAISESIYLNSVIYGFLMEHPNVQLNCTLQSPGQMKASLDDGTLNFAVCNAPIAGADLTWEPVYRDQMTIMLPQNHPLAHRKRLSLRELNNASFIVSHLGYDMSSETFNMCRLAGFEPRIVYKGSSPDLAGLLVSSGLGVMLTPYSISASMMSFQPPEPARKAPEEALNVVCIPLTDDFAAGDIGIVMKSGQFHSEAAQAFYRAILDFYDKLPSSKIL